MILRIVAKSIVRFMTINDPSGAVGKQRTSTDLRDYRDSRGNTVTHDHV